MSFILQVRQNKQPCGTVDEFLACWHLSRQQYKETCGQRRSAREALFLQLAVPVASPRGNGPQCSGCWDDCGTFQMLKATAESRSHLLEVFWLGMISLAIIQSVHLSTLKLLSEPRSVSLIVQMMQPGRVEFPPSPRFTAIQIAFVLSHRLRQQSQGNLSGHRSRWSRSFKIARPAADTMQVALVGIADRCGSPIGTHAKTTRFSLSQPCGPFDICLLLSFLPYVYKVHLCLFDSSNDYGDR